MHVPPGATLEIHRPRDPARAARLFEAGYAAGMRAAHGHPTANKYSGKTHYTYLDLEDARRRGFEEGRAADRGPARPGTVDAAAIRKKAIDDMLENCRVIAESNPNMTSEAFFKAVQHRSKKV